MSTRHNSYNRREFLKRSMVASAGLAAGTIWAEAASKSSEQASAAPLKIGFVGVGGMGSIHVRNILKMKGAEIRAVCDIVPEKAERIQKWVQAAGYDKPTLYTQGDTDFRRMCQQEDIDIVMTATPWKWHVPICISAMENGKHAATEVPAAVTIEECWKLVETAQKTGKHCVMLENCCYDRVELMVFNMVRKGLFGELLHGECGYMHDLRNVKLSKKGEGLWRTEHSIKRDGNLYPMHGLGPIAQCMNINRGDQFDYLVSMSCASKGLNAFAKEHLGKDHPMTEQKFALGDVNTSIIRTVKDRTILVQHDTNLPRPYSRKILLQGTKGIVRKYPEARIHIEGISPGHSWEPLSKYFEKYEHHFWKNGDAEFDPSLGHGGMDYLVVNRLIQALRKGREPDLDVYDAASWSAIAECTEKSVAKRSAPVDVPDFTKGAWKNRAPVDFS